MRGLFVFGVLVGLVALSFLPPAATVAQSVTVEQIHVRDIVDTTYLPYRLIEHRSRDGGVGSRPVSPALRVMKMHIDGGEEGIVLLPYNPSLNVGGPAIFSMRTYPSWVVEDDPVRLTINDWGLYDDHRLEAQAIAGLGFRADSTFCFRLDPMTDEYEEQYVCSGVDGTGDGVWAPELRLLLIADVDTDGQTEAFWYVNSHRERGPRLLVCVEMEQLRVDWVLPVASPISRAWFHAVSDSGHSVLWFVSYNPKQRVSDSSFSDLYGYLTAVDDQGHILRNSIIAFQHGGMNLTKAVGGSGFYLTHEYLPVAPEDTALLEPSPVYHLSRLDLEGNIVRTVELTRPPHSVWLEQLPGRSDSLLFVSCTDRVIRVFDTLFQQVAESNPCDIGAFMGRLRLASERCELLAFSSGLYTLDFDKQLAFPFAASRLDVVTTDSSGGALTIGISGGNRFVIGTVASKRWWEFGGVLVSRNHELIIAVLGVLLAALLVAGRSRQKAARQMEVSQARFREVLSHSRDIIFGLDANTGNFEYMSASIEAILGDPMSDIMAGGMKGIQSRVHPDDFAHMDSFWHILLSGDKAALEAPVEFRLRHRDGSYAWLSASHSVVRDARGAVSMVIGVVRNISAAKAAQEALKASEERFRELADLLPESVYEMDRAGVLTFANSAGMRRFGLTPEIVERGLTLNAVLIPEDVERARANIRRIFEGTPELTGIEYTAVDRSGKTFPIVTYTSAVVRAGAVAGVRGIAVDVTERREAEQRLRDSEEKYRLLVENVRAVITLVDYSGRFLYANQLAAGALYLKPEQLVGRTQWDVFSKEIADRQMSTIRRVIDSGDEVTVESLIPVNDAPGQWYLTTLHPYRDGSGQIVAALVIAHDITERKRVQEALRESESTARALINSVTESMILLDVSGRFVTLNETAAMRIGATVDDLVGTAILDLAGSSWPHDLAKQRLAQVREVVANGKPVRRQDERNGRVYDANMFPVFNDRGEVVRVALFASDITEQRRAQDALERSEERMRSTLTSMDDFVFLLDTEGVFLDYYQPGSAASLYAPPDSFIGKCYRDVFPEEAARTVASAIELLKATHQMQAIEYCLDIAGRQRWYSTKLSPVWQGSGLLIGITAVARDITAQKDNADALKASEERLLRLNERFALAADSARIGIWDYDVISDRLIWDDHMYRLYGINAEEFDGAFASWRQRIHPDDLSRSDAEVQVALRGEKDLDTEFRVRWADGSVHTIRAMAVVQRGANGEPLRMTGTNWDISAQKQAEEALRESAANFGAFFETIGDLIVVATTDGRILFTNHALKHKLGYGFEELADMRIPDLYQADARQEAEAAFAVMVEGEQRSCRLPLITKSGMLIPVETGLWSGTWNGADCVFGVSQDLSAEQEAQQRFERLFRSNPALMALTRPPDERFADVNDAFLRTMGYARGEVIGKTTVELGMFVKPEQQRSAATRLGVTGSVGGIELQVRRKDGTILDGLFSGEVVNSQGRQYFLTVMVNITDRKRAEEALRASEQFNRVVIENSPLGVSVRSRTGKLLSYNAAWERIWRVWPEDLDDYLHRERAELRFDERDHYLGPWQRDVERIYTRGGALHIPEIDLSASRKGLPRWLSQYFYAILNDDGEVDRVVIITEDISARKEAELRMAAADREKYEQAKQIAGGFAHEIRNALFPAESALMRLMPNELLPQVAENARQDYYRRAAEAVSRAIDVTELIAMYTKLDSERMPEVVDMVEVVNAVVASNQLRIEEQGVTVTIEAPPAIAVVGNAKQLYIVFNNLLLNSLDALIGRPNPRFEVVAKVGSGVVEVSVSDNGQGIPIEFLSKIFDTFFSSKPNKGTGLGLATVRKIVEMYDGKITVTSNPGKWTRFHLQLRLASHTEAEGQYEA